MYPSGISSLIIDEKEYFFDTQIYPIKKGTAYPCSDSLHQYQFYLTSLPILALETDEKIVNYEERPARSVFTTAEGEVITSDCGVKIRGGYSQTLPKKSFRLEFWSDSSGSQNRSLKLLDLRIDDDWVLIPMYNEPLRLRNATAHALWEEIHEPHYKAAAPDAVAGTRCRYIELFHNNKYQGVYLLTERVDRKQLDLDKYGVNGEIKGELYKGKEYASGSVTFDFLGFYSNSSRIWDGFEMKYPKQDEITDWRNLFDFLSFVLQSEDEVFNEHIHQWINPENAIDYFLFINLLYAEDNTGKNAYLAKHSEGEAYFFVPWDLDGVLGNNWQGIQPGYSTKLLSNGLYDRILRSCHSTPFGQNIKSRWNELRSSYFTTDSIYARVVANYNLLHNNGVYEREQIAWPDYIQSENNLVYLADWLNHRIAFMDQFIANCCDAENSNGTRKVKFHLDLYPNPASDKIAIRHVAIDSDTPYRIYDQYGRIIKQGSLGIHTTIIDIHDIPAGIYHLEINHVLHHYRKKWIKY